MALPIRYADFPSPGQSATIRILAAAADGSLLLLGRDGGQIGYGGTRSGEDLELHSNPSENGDLILGIVVIDEASGEIGVGVANPAVTVDVRDGAKDGDPAAAGTTQTAGLLRLRGSGPTVLDFGVRNSLGRAWIQCALASDLSQSKALGLNPNGGNVNVGVSPTADLFTAFNVIRIGSGSVADSVVVKSGGVAFFGTGSFGSGVGVVFLGNSTTKPTGSPAGGVLFEAHDVAAQSELFTKNEAGETARLTGLDARTTADFSKTDATLANVTGLFRNVEAGKNYSFVFRLYDQMSAMGGYALQLNGTCTATNLIAHFSRLPSSSATFSLSSTVPSLGHAAVGEATPAFATGYIECRGTIEVNAAGTFGIKFAQNSASGTSTIKRGSTLHLREIT